MFILKKKIFFIFFVLLIINYSTNLEKVYGFACVNPGGCCYCHTKCDPDGECDIQAAYCTAQCKSPTPTDRPLDPPTNTPRPTTPPGQPTNTPPPAGPTATPNPECVPNPGSITYFDCNSPSDCPDGGGSNKTCENRRCVKYLIYGVLTFMSDMDRIRNDPTAPAPRSLNTSRPLAAPRARTGTARQHLARCVCCTSLGELVNSHHASKAARSPASRPDSQRIRR